MTLYQPYGIHWLVNAEIKLFDYNASHLENMLARMANGQFNKKKSNERKNMSTKIETN